VLQSIEKPFSLIYFIKVNRYIDNVPHTHKPWFPNLHKIGNSPQLRLFGAVLGVSKSTLVGLASIALMGLYIYDLVEYVAGVGKVNIFADDMEMFLILGIALGAVLCMFVNYWSAWQNVRRKKGDEIKFSLNYAASMIISIVLSALVVWVLLTVGAGYIFTTLSIDNGLLTIVIGFVVTAIVAPFLDKNVMRELADGLASAAFVKTKNFFDENKAKLLNTLLGWVKAQGQSPSDVNALKKAYDMLRAAGFIDKTVKVTEEDFNNASLLGVVE